MSLSWRKFLLTEGGAGGTALAYVAAAACRATMRVKSGAVACDPHTSGIVLAIPATMPIGSGAPLGGISTGLVETRAEGCFYEWQIFNFGPWAQGVPSTTASPAPGPQYLHFALRVTVRGGTAQVRRFYLRSDENNLYPLPMLQDVESIDYHALFQITYLVYHDLSLPVKVSAPILLPIIPGNARDLAHPGFHVVCSIVNTSREKASVTLAGFLGNPLASALAKHKLTNTLSREARAIWILLNASAESEFSTGIGSMCFSATGNDYSFITGTFHKYARPGTTEWNTKRVRMMIVSIMKELIATGKLPNTSGETDLRIGLPSIAAIELFSPAGIRELIENLGSDALMAWTFNHAHAANPNGQTKADRGWLKEFVQKPFRRKPAFSLGVGLNGVRDEHRYRAGSASRNPLHVELVFPWSLFSKWVELQTTYV